MAAAAGGSGVKDGPGCRWGTAGSTAPRENHSGAVTAIGCGVGRGAAPSAASSRPSA